MKLISSTCWKIFTHILLHPETLNFLLLSLLNSLDLLMLNFTVVDYPPVISANNPNAPPPNFAPAFC